MSGGGLINHVGSLDLLDLEYIGRLQGRRFLPFPFMTTQPSRFSTLDEVSAYTRTIPDRFNYWDLSEFNQCMMAYSDADIRVAYHVQYIPDDAPSVRMVGFRAQERGFLAVQRSEADVVDFYTVSPYELGEVIAEAAQLSQPGRHARIVVPEYIRRSGARFDTGGVVVGDRRRSATEVVIPESDVSAYGRVQSDWRPLWKWGWAYDKPLDEWVRVIDDGDYLYTADHSYAQPVTRAALRERIDQLITEDVAALRQLRSDSGG